MITTGEVRDAMLRECDICIHLHGKIPEGGLDYCPTPGQRSTLELLRYLSFVGSGMTVAMATGSWDAYTAGEQESSTLEAADFPAAMERQKQAIREALDAITDEDARTRRAELPWGEAVSLGTGLLQLPYACLVAYRMQLFLYAKAAGNHDLNTPNCWAGVDMDM